MTRRARVVDFLSTHLVANPFVAVVWGLSWVVDRVGGSLDRRLCEWPRLTSDDDEAAA